MQKNVYVLPGPLYEGLREGRVREGETGQWIVGCNSLQHPRFHPCGSNNCYGDVT